MKNAFGCGLASYIFSDFSVSCKTLTDWTFFFVSLGELSVYVNSFAILTKSLLPLPDKFHGLTHVDKRYRQRWVEFSMPCTFVRAYVWSIVDITFWNGMMKYWRIKIMFLEIFTDVRWTGKVEGICFFHILWFLIMLGCQVLAHNI